MTTQAQLEGVRLIGQLARAAGVSVHTVRYYERLGLLPPPLRRDSGYRVYSPATLERLRFIRQAQAAGLRLDEIREVLRLKYAGQSPCDCVRALLQQKLVEVEREMAELRRFRRELHAALKRSQKLPRLPHRASAICPILESAPRRGHPTKP
ncbi:MAG: heavy metal-responsive transcriptional regulator [Acidobacteria bacterium]|nr:heavy metal-responsive transcriptional regulator [Acidobacteriota bacterium]